MSLFFWYGVWLIALLWLFYTYAGYPLGMVLLSRWKAKQSRRDPSKIVHVSIVLAVRNEQQQVKAKIDNLMSLDYPAEWVELILIDDGSTDETYARMVEAAEIYKERRMVVLSLPESAGKTVALNRAVLQAQGELLLFCDARQRVDRNALRVLVAVFADEQVGAASGELVLETEHGPGLYWRYERAIRDAEGQYDSVIGVSGALYMIRRDLFQPFPEGLILDDVWMPMQIAMRGYRVLFVAGAMAFDREASIDREFQRKTRTLTGNFQLLAIMPRLLSPWHNRLFWSFFSHKIMRLLCPYALLLLAIANGVIVFRESILFSVATGSMLGQIGLYALAGLEPWLPGVLRKMARVMRTFVVLNWAAVIGFKRFLSRDFRWTR